MVGELAVQEAGVSRNVVELGCGTAAAEYMVVDIVAERVHIEGTGGLFGWGSDSSHLWQARSKSGRSCVGDNTALDSEADIAASVAFGSSAAAAAVAAALPPLIAMVVPMSSEVLVHTAAAGSLVVDMLLAGYTRERSHCQDPFLLDTASCWGSTGQGSMLVRS